MSQAKHDEGKPRAALVPAAIIEAVARVRTFGTAKYHDPENWRQVSKEQYEHAFLRHTLEWMRDRNSVDAESGLPHSWHMSCNLDFILTMEGVKNPYVPTSTL